MCYLVSPFVCKVVKGVFISFLLLSKTLSRVSCSLFTPGMRSGQSPRCWNFFRLSPSLSALKLFSPLHICDSRSLSCRRSVACEGNPAVFLLIAPCKSTRSFSLTFLARSHQLTLFFTKIPRSVSPGVFVAPPRWKNDTCLFFLRRLLKLKYQNLSLLSCEYLLSAPVTPPSFLLPFNR